MSNRKDWNRTTVLQALATLRMVLIEFGPAYPGVVVPERFADKERLSLDFGRRAPTPIDDLECEADAISGTLRFGDEYFHCSIPWEAITAITPHGPKPAARAWNPTVIDGGKS